MKKSVFCFGILMLNLLGCYEPSKQNQPLQGESTGSSASSGEGQVAAINGGYQICNPAISADTVNFPGAMLWLGFSGDLNVKNAPEGYSTTEVIQHDRLTISNADNSVAWFLLMDSVPGVECEFQDPDWSTHPDWIVTMGARASNGDCENGSYIYSGWVIRPTDGARFRFQKDGLEFMSTPHVWIDPALPGPEEGTLMDTAEYESSGIAKKTSVESFFGGKNVKAAWSVQENGYSIQYVDYAESNPQIHTLLKPEGRETWKAESGMISPDGKWIAYNLYQRLDQYAAYVQKLSPGSKPVLVSEGAMDPRWWVHPKANNRLFLVFIRVPEGEGYLIKQNLADPKVLESASAGSTWMQELVLAADMPADLAVEWIGNPRKIVDLPFRGGRSPDGNWLATGTNDGFMMELPQ